jgi:hypothetical protein
VSRRFTPSTEQYPRETVPQRLWITPQLTAINRDLTRMWALVFVAMVPSHVIAGIVDTHRADAIFTWVVPIVLVVWAAKRTDRVSGGGEIVA